MIEPNASRYHGKAPNELAWTDAQKQRRAVAEYLAAVEAEAKAAEEQTRRDADTWTTMVMTLDRRHRTPQGKGASRRR